MEALGYAVLGSMLSGQKLETVRHTGAINYSSTSGSSTVRVTLAHKPAVIYAISTERFLAPGQSIATYISGGWTTSAIWDGNITITYSGYHSQNNANGNVSTALILIG